MSKIKFIYYNNIYEMRVEKNNLVENMINKYLIRLSMKKKIYYFFIKV